MKSYKRCLGAEFEQPINHKAYMEHYNEMKQQEHYFNMPKECPICLKMISRTNLARHKKAKHPMN